MITLRPRAPSGENPTWLAAVVAVALNVVSLVAITIALAHGSPDDWLGRLTPPARREASVAERLTYVVPAAPPVSAAPAPQAERTPPPVERTPAPVRRAPVPGAAPAPTARPGPARGDTTAAPPRLVNPSAVPSTIPPPSSSAGARGAPCAVPCAEGAAVGAGAGERAPASAMSKEERDSIIRSLGQTAAELAKRGVQGGNVKTGMGGTSIAVPLPGGGPSKAQRERDRRIYGENMEIMARIKARADSIAAARRRDSLAAARRDSLNAARRDTSSLR